MGRKKIFLVREKERKLGGKKGRGRERKKYAKLENGCVFR